MQNTDVTHETPVSVFAALAVAVVGIVVQCEALTWAGAVRACGRAAAPAALPSMSDNGSAINTTANPAVRTRTVTRMPASPPSVFAVHDVWDTY